MCEPPAHVHQFVSRLTSPSMLTEGEDFSLRFWHHQAFSKLILPKGGGLKKLMLLWQSIAADAAIQCRTSASHDINTIMTRVEHEGIGVLTLSLPEIGRAFERSLDEGQVTDALLSLCGKKRGFPAFMQNFLQLVFDRKSGRLLDDPSVTAIHAIRQLTLAFGKLQLPCTSARTEQAFSDYIQCEQSLQQTVPEISTRSLRDFSRISTMLFGDVFSKMDKDIHDGNVVPRHGPGATADKLLGNKKFVQTEWTDRLESIFPAMEHAIPNFRYTRSLTGMKWLDPGTERPVRVIAVPKTLKTPRIIAIEPTCMQYMQQGIMEMMVKYLESNHFTRGMIGIEDQVPNQDLAQRGSQFGDLATLDLSEASDRVSLRLVMSMVYRWPSLSRAILATRSTRADVPGYGVIPLTKYASMGSALTFPMEVCVFLTTIFLGIESSLGRRLTRRDVESFRGRVRVYGDDIIVPVGMVQSVVDSLETFSFKVNRHKSFWTGRFRESCGKEYYDGHEVSIFRVRHGTPSHRSDVSELISTVSLRNQAYWSGYWNTAKYLDGILERLIPFPNVDPDSSVLGRQTVLGYDQERFDPKLQRPLVKGVAVKARLPISHLEDEWALLKWFLKRGALPYASDHLERQGRPRVVGIEHGWHCPY